MVCPLRAGKVLPQVEEFRNMGFWSMSEGRMERAIDRWIGAASALMQPVYWTIIVI